MTFFERIFGMNKPLANNKKRLYINLALIVLAIVLVAAVVAADAIANRKGDLDLTAEQAQAYIEQTLAGLPTVGAECSKYTVENTKIEVLDVQRGEAREFVVRIKYTTPDAAGMYEAHKNELFCTVHEYILQREADGKKVNATAIQIFVEGQIKALLEQQGNVQGEIDVYFYDTREEQPVMYMSDEALDALLGGYVSVKDDIMATTEFTYGGETVSITNNNTFRKGINQCFGLVNYDAKVPDTSSPLQQKLNSIGDEFYRNFIEDNRWLYLVEGLGNTLAITALALLLGIALGVITSLIRIVHDKTDRLYYLDKLVKLYISAIRGTPVMVQLLIIYFVLLLPVGIEKFPAAVLCFGLNSGAYVSEIIRGGIMSIDQGQTEAGRSLGFGFWPTMWHIVIPQAFKVVLPSLCNEFITLLKETSVAFYIGVADLTRGGIKIRSQTYSNFMPLLAVALIYFVLVLGLTKLVSMLERRLRKSER